MVGHRGFDVHFVFDDLFNPGFFLNILQIQTGRLGVKMALVIV